MINAIAKKNLKNPVVFHAASAGEFEQIKPLLRAHKSNNSIIQTFFSPTIYNKEKDSKLFNECCYHPFDFPWTAYFFFKKLRPSKYIVNRHDIWPHHIFFAKKFNIKIIYMNANLKSNSLRLKFIFKSFHKWLFNQIDTIIVPSNEIKDRFVENFGTKNISIHQDSRFKQIQYRINKNKKITGLAESLSDKKTVILGSIDIKDWEIILKSIKKTKLNNFNLIVVPHEIDNIFIEKIIRDLKDINLTANRFTNIEPPKDWDDYWNVDINDRLDCIIYDKVGDLLDLYKYGSLAYVGCGFSTGVHNVAEPALQGCYVSYGPNIELLDEAVRLKEQKLSRIIYNSKDFSDFTNISDGNFLDKNRDKVFDLFKKNDDEIEKVIEIIYE
tara:strand:+ start:500 stop:1651 length:1152 start_codon:yes stop_codon:yes gene_type:complete